MRLSILNKTIELGQQLDFAQSTVTIESISSVSVNEETKSDEQRKAIILESRARLNNPNRHFSEALLYLRRVLALSKLATDQLSFVKRRLLQQSSDLLANY